MNKANYVELLKDENKIKATVFRLGDSKLTEHSHSFNKYGPISILESAKDSYKNRGGSAKKNQALAMISVVLAANRDYNKVVVPNLERIKKEHPKLKTLSQLVSFYNSTSKKDFFQFWGHKDQKKYDVLGNILKVFGKLKKKFPDKSDYKIMNNWALNCSVQSLKLDPIASINNVGIATFQHLRMTFGIDTVKPDQRVLEVLEKEFGFKKVKEIDAIGIVEKMAKIVGLSVFEVDQIFVRYGSGYYREKIQSNYVEEIASNLKKLGVEIEKISAATGLSLEQLNDL